MNTNKTTNRSIIYPELSYAITDICFSAHNELGRYAREKQYGNLIENGLKENKIPYKRECAIGTSKNVVDFIINDKIILELKAKRILIKEDYYQTQRYLQETKLKLAFLINFRDRFIKPKRIIRIDTENREKFNQH